jgi:hypothetical protein
MSNSTFDMFILGIITSNRPIAIHQIAYIAHVLLHGLFTHTGEVETYEKTTASLLSLRDRELIKVVNGKYDII